tara:strand:+ start:152 stop:778 length:627 start_codon:yes stop_codon:yes gene_type:complete
MAAREFYDAVLRALRQRQQFFVAGVTAHPLYKHSVLGRAASATNLSRLNLILAAMTVVLVIGVFAIGFESGIWLLNFLVTMVLPLISTFRELCGSDTTAQRGWLLFWGVGASLTCFFHFTTLFTKWGGSTVSLIRFVCLALLQLPELNLKVREMYTLCTAGSSLGSVCVLHHLASARVCVCGARLQQWRARLRALVDGRADERDATQR